jgi:hypothetical protein
VVNLPPRLCSEAVASQRLIAPGAHTCVTDLVDVEVVGHSNSRASTTSPLAKTGPKYLRWALIEVAVHAAKHPAYREHYERTAARLGRQRGKKVARVEVARKLAEAIWHMCTPNRPFTPARSHLDALVA